MLVFIEPNYPWEELFLLAKKTGLKASTNIDSSKKKYNAPLTFALMLSNMAGNGSIEAYKSVYLGVVPLQVVPITIVVDDYEPLLGPITRFDLLNNVTVLHGSLLDWKITMYLSLSRGASQSQREYAARLFTEFRARDYGSIWGLYSFNPETLTMKEK